MPFSIPGGRQARPWRELPRGALRWLLPVGVGVALAASWVGGEPEDAPGEPASAAVEDSRPAPELEVPTVDGFRFDLGRERGSAVLVARFDGVKIDAGALGELAAAVEGAADRTRGSARAVAVCVGTGLAELRASLGHPPSGLAIAADPDGRAMAGFTAAAGGGAWWIVDRRGRVVERGTRPGPEAITALLAAARRP
jgi:hypothetical protein